MVAPPPPVPFQVSRSAWSVIGWVTISPPKINSENSLMYEYTGMLIY